MKEYKKLSASELAAEKALVEAKYQELKNRNLSLDMSRGKPSKAQLDMVSGLLTALTDPADCIYEGMDVRNYGNLGGLPAAKKLFSELLGCRPQECLMGGSSSLTLMYDLLAKGMLFGLNHSPAPWSQAEGRKCGNFLIESGFNY